MQPSFFGVLGAIQGERCSPFQVILSILAQPVWACLFNDATYVADNIGPGLGDGCYRVPIIARVVGTVVI